jgi:superoxide dismutase, Cu-Zn family
MSSRRIWVAVLAVAGTCGCSEPLAEVQPAVPTAPAPPVRSERTQPPGERIPGGPSQPASDGPRGPSAERTMEVPILPRSGSSLAGSVTLVQAPNGVNVTVSVSGATPGQHGVHFHENPDCSAPDATSAGGHYNPQGHAHGLPPGERHLGDLGNLTVDAQGHGSTTVFVEGATLDPGAPLSLLGRSVIVHAKLDTGAQPVGNAGERVGCAVIPTQ